MTGRKMAFFSSSRIYKIVELETVFCCAFPFLGPGSTAAAMVPAHGTARMRHEDATLPPPGATKLRP